MTAIQMSVPHMFILGEASNYPEGGTAETTTAKSGTSVKGKVLLTWAEFFCYTHSVAHRQAKRVTCSTQG